MRAIGPRSNNGKERSFGPAIETLDDQPALVAAAARPGSEYRLARRFSISASMSWRRCGRGVGVEYREGFGGRLGVALRRPRQPIPHLEIKSDGAWRSAWPAPGPQAVWCQDQGGWNLPGKSRARPGALPVPRWKIDGPNGVTKGEARPEPAVLIYPPFAPSTVVFAADLVWSLSRNARHRSAAGFAGY